ncbi:MAG: type II toxin-antitoxin system RelE/ParE family toxin [Thermoanaerobaculia bacterium]
MTRRLRWTLTRRSAREISEAAAWWEANRPKAPTAFDDDLQKALNLITAQPNIGTQARNMRMSGVQRVHLSRVRYYLYYRVSPSSGEVVVLCLWHMSRGSDPRL